MDLLRAVAERNFAQVEHILQEFSGGKDGPSPVGWHELAARIAEAYVSDPKTNLLRARSPAH